MKMYVLIKEKVATMWELKNVYTLGEALKLHALIQMEKDIERCYSDEMQSKSEGRR